MVINEAAVLAAEEGKCMTRRSVRIETGGNLMNIKPTNSSECCAIVSRKNERPSCRFWNPTLDDLTADDWIVVDNPAF